MTTDLTFRLATKEDLDDIVQMLLDNTLGALREKPDTTLSDRYVNAFEKIRADSNQELTVVELNGEKVATFQLSFIQYLTYQGGMRVQIEAVRTKSTYGDRESERRCLTMLSTEPKKRDAV